MMRRRGISTLRVEPRVINVDKHAAYPKAINALKAAQQLPESCELRQVNYLNTLIEHDPVSSSGAPGQV
jgi:transposase-like protein